LRSREIVVEVEIMQEGLKNPSMHERRAPTLEVIREEVLPLNPVKYPQQCEFTMLRADKNKNGKRDPMIQIIGKKVRKLNTKKSNLEKLHEVPENTSQKAGLPDLNLVGIEEQRRLKLLQDEAI
jgi:hypothetical protein